MSGRPPCPEPEELLDGLDLSPDPHAAHVDECPRCAALRQQFAVFEGDTSLPAEANVDAAERALADGLQDELNRVARPTVASTGAGAWWLSLRPMLGILIVVGAIGLGVVSLRQATPPEDVLRGRIDPTVALQPPVAVGDELVFTWDAHAGADGYEVRFYSPELDEVGVERTAQPSLRIPRARAAGWGHDRLLWKVTATSAGDPIIASKATPFALP